MLRIVCFICSFVKYSLQQTQEYLKTETFPVSELTEQVRMRDGEHDGFKSKIVRKEQRRDYEKARTSHS